MRSKERPGVLAAIESVPGHSRIANEQQGTDQPAALHRRVFSTCICWTAEAPCRQRCCARCHLSQSRSSAATWRARRRHPLARMRPMMPQGCQWTTSCMPPVLMPAVHRCMTDGHRARAKVSVWRLSSICSTQVDRCTGSISAGERDRAVGALPGNNGLADVRRCSGGQVAAEADGGHLPRRAGREGVGAAAPGLGAGCAPHPGPRAVLFGVLHYGAGGAAELRRCQRDAQQLGLQPRGPRCSAAPTVFLRCSAASRCCSSPTPRTGSHSCSDAICCSCHAMQAQP